MCLRNDLLYVVRVHPSVFVHHGLLLNLCFDHFLAYHCITILNTLCLSRPCGVSRSLYSTFRRTSSSSSHKHRMMTSSPFLIAPTPSSEPDVLPASFRIACLAQLLFGLASRYMYRFPAYSGPPPSNANTAFDGTWYVKRVSRFEASTKAKAENVDECVHTGVPPVASSSDSTNKSPSMVCLTTNEISSPIPGNGAESVVNGTSQSSRVHARSSAPPPPPSAAATQVIHDSIPTAASTSASSSPSARLGGGATPAPAPTRSCSAAVYFSRLSRIA